MLNKALAWTDLGSADPEESFDMNDIGNRLLEGDENAQEPSTTVVIALNTRKKAKARA
jgi:hypothetical protein